MQPPHFGEPGRVKPLALVRRRAERIGRLAYVVLLKPGLGQPAAQLKIFIAREARLFERADEQCCGIRAPPLLEGLRRANEEVRYRHAAQYTGYTPAWLDGLQDCTHQ